MTVRQETLRTPVQAPNGTLVRKEKGIVIFPGFCDVHVHFREPGFSYKETMVTGSRAAARGGYTAVCAMRGNSTAQKQSLFKGCSILV